VGHWLRQATGAVAGGCLLTVSAVALPGANPDRDTWIVSTDDSEYAPQSFLAVGQDWEQAEPLLGMPEMTIPSISTPPASPTSPDDGSAPPVIHRLGVGSQSIPATVLAAYRMAAQRLTEDDSSCGMRWQVLAGIGKVESGHAGGGRVTADGDAVPRILGPVLNGVGSVAAISDHDDGRWDLDSVWDRAVGPMQFIPGTWALFGIDGSGDGTADPNNVFDAALSAGHYLCVGTSEVRTAEGLAAALRRYNNSASYVATVMSWIIAYDNGTAVAADDAGADSDPGTDPAQPPSTTVTRPPTAAPGPTPSSTPSPSSAESPSPSPTLTPSPTPTATPSPTPTPSPSPTDPDSPTPPPTSCPSATPTPSPTDTATPTPTPTSTPTPTPTDTPTPTPSPTPTECTDP
jgi:hypothetical protein